MFPDSFELGLTSQVCGEKEFLKYDWVYSETDAAIRFSGK